MLNWIEVIGLFTLILYLLNELYESAKVKYQWDRPGESTILAIAFIVAPTLAYFFLSGKFIRDQLLSMAFYYSHRLFKVLSCGTRSVEACAHQKVAHYEKKIAGDKINVSDNGEVVDHNEVKVNLDIKHI